MNNKGEVSQTWKWSVGVGALIAFALGIWAAGSWHMPPPKQSGPAVTEGGYLYFPGRPVQAVGLIDHMSRPFKLEDWPGYWLIVNFGYLSCPDICPVTLSIMNEVLLPNGLEPPGKRLPEKIKALYVTVDPARDKPEQMQEYLSYFGEVYLGITGSEKDLTAFGRQLNAVFISQKKDDSDINYTVSHSSSLAVINPRGEFVAMLKGPDNALQLQQFLREVMPPEG